MLKKIIVMGGRSISNNPHTREWYSGFRHRDIFYTHIIVTRDIKITREREKGRVISREGVVLGVIFVSNNIQRKKREIWRL